MSPLQVSLAWFVLVCGQLAHIHVAGGNKRHVAQKYDLFVEKSLVCRTFPFD